MPIIRNIDDIYSNQRTAVTVGTFDGVHTGHHKIIEELIGLARSENLVSTIVTFEPHPRTVIKHPKREKVNLLTNYDEKISILENSGIDQLIVIEFTHQFAEIPYQEFVKNILVEKINASWIVVGHDHTFGNNRQGNFESLLELSALYHFKLKEVGPHQYDGETVSSSEIRNLLLNGAVERASRMLGYYYSMSGIVVKGEGRGHKLTFPTANISLSDQGKLVPGNGVYVVSCTVNGKIYRGMANIGIKPTFHGHTQTIEVHLFEFTENIYGVNIKISLLKRLRGEIKFKDEKELIKQLKQDRENSYQN